MEITEHTKTGDTKKTAREVLGKSLITIAIDKNISVQNRLKAMDMIMDRTNGKPRQQMELAGGIETTNKNLMSQVDISKMSKEEKKKFEELLEKSTK